MEFDSRIISILMLKEWFNWLVSERAQIKAQKLAYWSAISYVVGGSKVNYSPPTQLILLIGQLAPLRCLQILLNNGTITA